MKLLQFKNKVRNTNRLASMGSEESEESARELQERQKKLVLEEDNVRNVDNKLGTGRLAGKFINSKTPGKPGARMPEG